MCVRDKPARDETVSFTHSGTQWFDSFGGNWGASLVERLEASERSPLLTWVATETKNGMVC